MARISKRDYTTLQNIAYSFEANWTHVDQIVRWDAEVYRGGKIVGNLKGTFRESPSKDIEELVTIRIVANLENGVENRQHGAPADSRKLSPAESR